MDIRTPAAAFSPGEIIRDQLDELGWSPGTLAGLLRQPLTDVEQLLDGALPVGSALARSLAEAFPGTTASFWLNLESQWQLGQASRLMAAAID